MITTIIIPTFNESENLPRLLGALFALPLDQLHVLVIDDNSPDGTGDVAEALKSRYPRCLDVIHRTGKLGLGSAYIAGFKHLLEGKSEIIGQMDADFSHEPEKVPELFAALQNFDIALGSRYIAGGALDENWPFWRKGLSAFGNFYARTILRLPIRDTTGGFRLWRRHVLESLPLDRVRSNGYVFQVEMAYVAHRLGFSIREIPIYFIERKWGKSKISFRIQLEAAARVWTLPGRYRDLSPIKR